MVASKSRPRHTLEQILMAVSLQARLRDLLAVAWRLAVYIIALAVAVLAMSRGATLLLHRLGVHFAHPPGVRPAEEAFLGQLIILLAAILATAIVGRIGPSNAASLLPPRPTAAPHFLQGLLWGLGGVAATLAGIAALGGYRVGAFAVSGSALPYAAALWAVTALVNGFAENLAVLGYPLHRVAKVTGFLPAILLVGALFAAGHLDNAGENPLGLASLFLVGALLATTVWLTGDLWLSVGVHAGAVFAEDFLFSVPDSGVSYTGHLVESRLTGPAWLSGGSAGPEGSVIALPVFAILLALLWLVYRKRLGRSHGEVQSPRVEAPSYPP